MWTSTYYGRAAELTGRLMTALERDRASDKANGWPCTTRSPEGAALALRVFKMGVGQPILTAEHYEVIPTRTEIENLRQRVGRNAAAYWDALRDNCVGAMTQSVEAEHRVLAED
jgi:hypothetical protein